MGTTPDSRDISKIIVKIGAISVASSLSTLGLISSGPAALFGFKFRRSLAMPSQVMVISGIV
jgi:hypothetical protein